MKKYKYYIGLDAHKANCYFVIMNQLGKVTMRQKVPTIESELISFLENIAGSKALVFEETALSQWLYLTLREKVDRIVVCQGTPKKKTKNDYRDATEIADLLRVNRLAEVYHGADKYMELRDLIHGYDSLVQSITRNKNRLTSLYQRSAINIAGVLRYKDKEQINKFPHETQQFVAQKIFSQIELMEKQKASYLKLFKRNLREYKEMRLISSIPGFAEVFSNQLVAYIVTPKRFPSKYHFFSYAMLVKHSQISDGKLYGKKRVMAHRKLKGIFKTATNVALLGDNAFRRKYDELILRGVEEKRARNSINKSLAATVLGVWKRGKKYQDKYWEIKRKIDNKQNRQSIEA